MTTHWEEWAGVPPPLRINLWKHHVGFLRHCGAEAIRRGSAGVATLLHQLPQIGTALMDLYLGELSPQELAREILCLLQEQQCLSPAAYVDWLAAGAGYRLLSLSDQSSWVLRLGQSAERYVHVHPARGAPHTCRVRANLLKTALLVLTIAHLHEAEPHDTDFINRVRWEYLGLSPLRSLTEAHQLRRLLSLLRPSPQARQSDPSGNFFPPAGQ